MYKLILALFLEFAKLFNKAPVWFYKGILVGELLVLLTELAVLQICLTILKTW